MSLKGKKGVDISSSNGSVDMVKIKNAGYDFVMIRCGFGDDIKSQDDSQFEANVRKAEKAKLPWGVYIYSYALNKTEARSEVEHVKRLLKNKKPTLPVAFDMEDADGYKSRHGAMKKSVITDICKTFLSGIKKAGYYPMLYTSLSWIGSYIGTDVTDNYDLWVAQWNKTCDYKGDNLGMWQYGGEVNYLESNSISGVGKIDKDKCFKNYPTIIKNGGYNNWKKPAAKTLDKAGFKKGDSGSGVLALKQLLILLKNKGEITATMKNDGIFGGGTEKAVNQVLKKLGYKQNGIAGEKFIKKLGKLLN
ncbi:MAG: glycoside hydrolase family 25 protein [Ruminococcus sp.]|nr:glycoside hydrolase family 25 protein [Ruminococcus sp.]